MRFAAAVIAVLALAGCSRDGAEPTTLAIAAASSLRDLATATQPAFEAAHPGVKLAFSFDASSSLARQIEGGGAFDVFLSADQDNVERVRALLAADSIRPLLRNRLALVGRPELAEKVHSPADLAAQSGRIALAGAAVPAGKYARAYLQAKGLLDALAPRIVDADHVRAALALVESETADFAIVYATDAKAAKRAALMWTAPDEDDPGIVYFAARLARASAPAAAYLDFLASGAFLAAAERAGFVPPRLPG